MNIFPFKKKRKPILYEKFKQDKLASESNEIKTKKENNTSEKKEKEVANKQEVIKLPDFDSAVIIAVCSLDKSTGCTHLSMSLAEFLKKNKKSVCIMSTSSLPEDFNNRHSVLNIEMLFEVIDKYKYIIIDIGAAEYTKFQAMKLAQIKIMMAICNEKYIKKLAAFTESEELSSKWKYVFNFVPKKQEYKVDDLMEDYEHWCFPVCNGKDFDKDTKEVFRKLVTGERL